MRLLSYSLLEQLGPRQRTVWWRVRAMFWNPKYRTWGDMQRTGVGNLSGDSSRSSEKVRELATTEQLLKETLTTAQQLSDDLKHTAVKEAEILISQAEIQGEKVLEAAHRRAARLAEDIREMKRLRTRLAGSLRGSIERHLEMLDQVAEDPPVEESGIEQRVDVLGLATRDPGRRGE